MQGEAAVFEQAHVDDWLGLMPGVEGERCQGDKSRASAPPNLQESHPADALLMPKIRPAKPRTIRNMSIGSSPAWLPSAATGTEGMQARPVTSEISSTGIRMMKTKRHPMVVATRPPKVGPTAGPMAVIRVPTPIMVPMRFVGTSWRMMLNIRGRAMLVPSPCMALPGSRRGKTAASASVTSPVRKSRLAHRKRVRLRNRRFRAAESGVMEATTSR